MGQLARMRRVRFGVGVTCILAGEPDGRNSITRYLAGDPALGFKPIRLAGSHRKNGR